MNDHWKWPLEQFTKNIDRQGLSWSQRVKEAVVDLGEEEGLRLLDVIGGAIKQRERPVDEILAALGPGVDL